MKNISMIACVGKNLELGKNNTLIWHLPNDLKYFKNVTSGKTIIMGRKTYDSLPNGKLPNRRNIVLQLKEESNIEGVDIFNNIPDILNNVKDEQEVFITGGASIYKQFLPYANKLYLTEVDEECSDASVYFPSFDKKLYKKSIISKECDNDINYQFVIYERIDE